MGWKIQEFCKTETFYIEKPTISTGAGDNFNARFCIGTLSALKLEQCLMLGNATSAFYIQQGKSPKPQDLLRFLQEKEGGT